MLGKRYVVESAAEAYKEVGKDLFSNGIYSSPRGAKTVELIAPQIVITDPRQRLVQSDARKFNIFHALNESVLLFSTSDKVTHIAEFNKNMANYSDDGEVMYGSYGKRISGYIEVIVEKLRADKDTRQAVLGIYESKDMVAKTKDVPCTSTLQFLIRENKLHLITTMRSNDILFGFQFDVVMFTNLQETIANTLGIDVGNYIHQPASLHVYESYPKFSGYDMLSEMVYHSESVSFTNNSDVHDWMTLADKMQNPMSTKYDIKYSGTTEDIYRLMSLERFRRLYVKVTDSVYKPSLIKGYENSPSWAKPFLEKWNIKEME